MSSSSASSSHQKKSSDQHRSHHHKDESKKSHKNETQSSSPKLLENLSPVFGCRHSGVTTNFFEAPRSKQATPGRLRVEARPFDEFLADPSPSDPLEGKFSKSTDQSTTSK